MAHLNNKELQMVRKLNWETANSIGRANLTIIAEIKHRKKDVGAHFLEETEALIGAKKPKPPKKWWDPRKRKWRFSHNTKVRKQP